MLIESVFLSCFLLKDRLGKTMQQEWREYFKRTRPRKVLWYIHTTEYKMICAPIHPIEVSIRV